MSYLIVSTTWQILLFRSSSGRSELRFVCAFVYSTTTSYHHIYLYHYHFIVVVPSIAPVITIYSPHYGRFVIDMSKSCASAYLGIHTIIPTLLLGFCHLIIPQSQAHPDIATTLMIHIHVSTLWILKRAFQ